MNAIETKQVTAVKPIPQDRGWGDRTFLQASYGMWWPRGAAQRPHFSITGDIFRKARNDKRVGEGGGCCHELIADLFPDLKPLIPWHLCDDDGTPMYYEANGLYHAEYAAELRGPPPYALGEEKTRSPDGWFEVLADHCLADVIGDRQELRREVARLRMGEEQGCGTTARKDFTAFLASRRPALAKAFAETMARFHVRMIDTALDTAR